MSLTATTWLAGISLLTLFSLFFRQTLILRMTTVFLLFGTAIFYLFGLLGPFTRGAITLRYKQGNLSDDFSAGVYALAAVYRPLLPLVIVPIIGLALLAVIGVKKRNG